MSSRTHPKPPRNFLHFSRNVVGREDAFFKQDIGKSDNPTLVIGELSDKLDSKSFHAAALLLRINDLVKIKDIGKGVAPLFPRLEFVLNAFYGTRLEPAKFGRKIA